MSISVKTISQKITISVVAISIVFSVVGFQPRHAEAQIPVTDVGNFGVNLKTSVETAISAIQDTLSAVSLGSLELKEYQLDPILFALAKKALSQIVSSTVDWVNSGFNGDPAFITDLEGLLLDTGDAIAGEFIYGSDLNFLCSPFRLDVQATLSTLYDNDRNFGRNIECTLSDVVDNIDDFYNGNFLAGGWDGFFELTTNPRNNIYGATHMAAVELEGRIIASRGRELAQAEWGSGFLTQEECTTTGHPGVDQETTCSTITPGRVISEALTFDLSVGERVFLIR